MIKTDIIGVERQRTVIWLLSKPLEYKNLNTIRKMFQYSIQNFRYEILENSDNWDLVVRLRPNYTEV